MRLTIATATAVVLVASTVAAANPSVEFLRAKGEFESGRYGRTVEILRPQLYPRLLITDKDEIKEAHKLLGIAYYYLGEEALARTEFQALLFLEPTFSLSAVQYESKLYAFVEGIRRENEEKLEKIKRQQQLEAERKKKPSKIITIAREHHPQETWKNWVPFGAGQFKNGETGKGIAFLAVELVSLGASTGIVAFQLAKYGFDLPVKADLDREGDFIRSLQYAQIGSGVVFLGAYLSGVYDAYANQKPNVTETVTEKTLGVIPLIAPHAAGATFHWEF